MEEIQTETRNYSLYYLKHPTTREIRYVGITNNPEKRYSDHRSASKGNKYHHLPIYRWWRKLAKQGLEPAMEILKSGLTKEEAEQAEIETIELYRKYSNRMLNITAGGNLSRVGVPLSEETKKKLSEANKGKTLSEETKRKVSKAVKDRLSSEEARKKISESLKGRKVKTYTFLYNGNKVVIHGLSQFCKDNDLNVGSMCAVHSGKRKSHRGWTAVKNGGKNDY